MAVQQSHQGQELPQQLQDLWDLESLSTLQQGLKRLPLLPRARQPELPIAADQIGKARQLGMEDPLQLKPALAPLLPLVIAQPAQMEKVDRRIGCRLITGQPAVLRKGALESIATADQRPWLQPRIVFHQCGSGRALRLLQTFALQPLTVIKP